MAETERIPTLIKFPLGVDNRSREYAVPLEALRVCKNLDVTRDGGLICRQGAQEILSGSFHSMFHSPNNPFLLFVKDGSLSTFDGTTVLTISSVVGPTQYTELNGDIFWTDGVTTGRVTKKGEAGLWGLPNPPLPQITVGSGSLLPGTYQLAMTVIHTETGIESGASDTVSVDISADESISVLTPSATGVQFAVYCSTLYGNRYELFQAALLAPATSSIITPTRKGKPLASLHATPPPPGALLAAFAGRLWIADKQVLWFTADSPHWVFRKGNYFLVEHDITFVGGVQDGLYVATESMVYFLDGTNPLEMTLREVDSVGAVSGQATHIDQDFFRTEAAGLDKQVFWVDCEGYLCIGKSGGVIIRPTGLRYQAPAYANFFGTTRKYEGLKQLLFSGKILDTANQPWASTTPFMV